MTGQSMTPVADRILAALRKPCPQCGKPGATAEHVMWCDWQPR
jgi:hypothetical protein